MKVALYKRDYHKEDTEYSEKFIDILVVKNYKSKTSK